uniref:Uncharacterized protein n=1 Tax=Pithovirus LCPAC304 TaxID=2506594 RepID=A0A481Z935_9VIRU|nr:MAG: hypothetical protein LCPAC304_03480 [Pithovirus LCPAC304]
MEDFTSSIKFYFRDDLVMWKGPCTAGHVSCTWNRVWFRPNAAASFDLYELRDPDCCNETKRDLESDEVDCPGDDYNLRAESLKDIIKGLKGELQDSCRYISNIMDLEDYGMDSTLDLILHIAEKYYKMDLDGHSDLKEIREQCKEEHPILISMFPTQSVWILHRKDDIIMELYYILHQCTKNGVKWISI